MAPTSSPLEHLKHIKNSIIGNPSAKTTLAKDGSIPLIVDYLNPDPSQKDVDPIEQDTIRTDAAHVVASLALGSPDALQSLLDAKAHQAVLYALSNSAVIPSATLQAALARALKCLGAATADIVGPPLWGLSAENANIREEAREALEDFFNIAALDVYLPLLLHPSQVVVCSICALLASSLRVDVHRVGVAEWLPPAERVKGKRGWEKPDVRPNGPRRHGGWVARNLISFLKATSSKTQEAALSALAALVKGNQGVAIALTRPHADLGVPSFLTILALTKSRAVEVQIAACLCATHALRSMGATTIFPLKDVHILTLIHILNYIIANQKQAANIKAKACFVLSFLVNDDCAVEQIAFDCGSLSSLADTMLAITPNGGEWDEEEAQSIYALREAVLTACATLVLHVEDSRQHLSTHTSFMSGLCMCLGHPQVGVRHAACQLVRALCRSVSVLRTNVVDLGLGLKLFAIVRKETEDRRVRIGALAAMCNLISPFSPAKLELIERGGIDRLVEFLHSEDEGFRINASWAIRNCLCNSAFDEKRMVVEKMGWDSLRRMLNDPDDSMREQGISIVNNIISPSDAWGPEVAFVFDGLGKEDLFDCLESVLSSANEGLVVQGLETLANLATGTDDHRYGFSRPNILAALRNNLQDPKVPVRRAAAGCVCKMLTCMSPPLQKDLRDAGIELTLRNMYGSGATLTGTSSSTGLQMGKEDDREVREQVSAALAQLMH